MSPTLPAGCAITSGWRCRFAGAGCGVAVEPHTPSPHPAETTSSRVPAPSAAVSTAPSPVSGPPPADSQPTDAGVGADAGGRIVVGSPALLDGGVVGDSGGMGVVSGKGELVVGVVPGGRGQGTGATMMGHGAGTDGAPSSAGGAGARAQRPTAGAGAVAASRGGLPAQVIERVVRAHSRQLRDCYEEARVTRPKLAGKVAVRFVIGRDGSVTSAVDAGSDLPDDGTIACVVRLFA